ncbi:MAG: thioredoxin-disulfide reductase [Patescibacteria group bacterium]|nr:thioredoxin-disulfide reductase [Patescibacteria group bacterium]
MYDIIVIGAGPAGLAAALYTSRRMLKTLVIAKNVGGQAAQAKRVENYPGIKAISGMDISMEMKEQAEGFGSEFKLEEALGVEKKAKKFVVKTSIGKYEAKSVILAFGLTPRDLSVPGEKEFVGKGVSYCATCDAPFFKDKTVAVVGGGNSAIDGALVLSKIAKKVYIVHRRASFRAEAELVCQIEDAKNIEPVLNSVVKEIRGKDVVQEVVIENVETRHASSKKTDGIFIEVGLMPKTGWVKDTVKLDGKNQIITNKNCETSTPGIFAAGDVSDVLFKQIGIAAGEGAIAALMAHRYILKLEGKDITQAVPFDWGKCK